MANNSQVPGSHVLLFTFGDEKNLWFAKKRKGEFKDGSLMLFRQKHCSMFLLNGKDEEFNDGGLWKHMSNMKHPGGITYTIILRCVQMTAAVNGDGTLANPTATASQLERFNAAEGLFDTEDYKENREDIELRMLNFLSRHKPR